MRNFLFPLSLISTLVFTGQPLSSFVPKFGDCCGRCVGSAYCTACKNCSRCIHCNSGGTCGVCSSGSSRSFSNSSSYERSSPAKNSSSRFTAPSRPAGPQKQTYTYIPERISAAIPTTTAWVKSESLNVRKGPGTEYEVIGKLYQSDQVELLEPVASKWVQVLTQKYGKGYVYASYLR